MDPTKINLENLSKNFEYHKCSLEIDDIDDIEELKNIAKCYCKLYLKQQEVLATFSSDNIFKDK